LDHPDGRVKPVSPGEGYVAAEGLLVNGAVQCEDWPEAENWVVPAAPEVLSHLGSLRSATGRARFRAVSRLAAEIEKDFTRCRLGVVEDRRRRVRIILVPTDGHPSLGAANDPERDLRVANMLIAAFGQCPGHFTRTVAYFPVERNGWSSLAVSRIGAILPFVSRRLTPVEPCMVTLLGLDPLLTRKLSQPEPPWNGNALRLVLQPESRGSVGPAERARLPVLGMRAWTVEVARPF
jgi:hypothetical protein